MAVDAVLRPLEADVVTMRDKYGMEMGLCKCAIAIWLGSSSNSQNINRKLEANWRVDSPYPVLRI